MVVVWCFCVDGVAGHPLRLASLVAYPLRFAKGEDNHEGLPLRGARLLSFRHSPLVVKTLCFPWTSSGRRFLAALGMTRVEGGITGVGVGMLGGLLVEHFG